MDVAIEEARSAFQEGEVPVGAVIVRADAVVFRSHNSREAAYDPIGHAELLAMRGAGARLHRWRLTDCTLYVTLEPCPMCAAAIVEARIPRVVFGASDPRRGALGSWVNLPYLLGASVEVIGGIREEECEALLQAFFRERRVEGEFRRDV